MSFLSSVNHTTKTSGPKIEGTAATTESGTFSQLLASAAAEAKEPGISQSTEIQAKLEEILKALEDLPQEELTPEQQEMLSAIVQLLSLQSKQLETELQKLGIVEEKLAIEQPDQVQEPIIKDSLEQSDQVKAPVVKASSEQLPVKTSNEEKMAVLLQQIQQKLEQLSIEDSIEFNPPMKIMGAEAENLAADPEQHEQALKQLTQLIQNLENAEAVNGKPVASPQSEKLEQVMKQLTQLTQELESQSSPVETPKINSAPAEAIRMAQTVAAFQPIEIAGLKVETVQQPEMAEPAAPAPVAPAEGAKAQAVQTAPRTEAPPAVRMANLVEDLSEVLRGSMRLTGTGETAQIKVSIFPEHLGHLDIRLTTVDGKVAAQIFTSSVMAKEAIEMQLNQLRNTMLQQGVNLDRVEITQQSPQQSFGQQTSNPEQRFAQQQKQGTTSANKNGYQRIEEEVAATTGRSQTPDGSMMKVDYTI